MKTIVYRGNQIHLYDDGSASAFVLDRYDDIEEIPCDSLEKAKKAIDRHMGSDSNLDEGFVSGLGYGDFEEKSEKEKAKKHKRHKKNNKKEPFEYDSEEYMEAQSQIEEFFKRDGVDIAPYSYKLAGLSPESTDEEELSNKRSLFYKKLYHEENSEGHVYRFTPSELVRLQSIISSETSLKEQKTRSFLYEARKSFDKLNERWRNRTILMTNESRRILKESYQDAIDYFIGIVQDCDDDYYEIIKQLRSLESEGTITTDDYNYITEHWDEILSQYGY